MVEFPLKWVIIMAGAFLLLALGFGVLLVYLLVQRSAGKTNTDGGAAVSGADGKGFFSRLEDRIFDRRSRQTEAIVAPPAQGEANQRWLLLCRQPETEQLTLSLPGKEIILQKEMLSAEQLMYIKTMALGLQHWLGLTQPKPIEKPAQIEMPMPAVTPSSTAIQTPNKAEPSNSLLTRGIFSRRREVEEIKPMVSMAVQINAVLQNILIQERYSGAEVYLTDNEYGDLVVVIGSEKYIGIESVPDPVVAGLIKLAAERWTEQNLRRGK